MLRFTVYPQFWHMFVAEDVVVHIAVELRVLGDQPHLVEPLPEIKVREVPLNCGVLGI